MILAWNPSPDTTNVAGYYLYGSTNEINFDWGFKVNVGTNLIVTVQNNQPGQWWFRATAYGRDTNYIESAYSNVLPVYFPEAPTGLGVMVLQYAPIVTSSNWQDVGYLRIKNGVP